MFFIQKMDKLLLSTIFAFGVFGLILANSVEDFRNGEVSPRDFMSDIINNTINKIVNNLTDPISSNNLTLDLSNLLNSSGFVNISNLQLYGIKSLVVPTLQVDILSTALNMTASLTEIKLSLGYSADIVLAHLIPFYGSGDCDITFDEINLQISGKANTTDGIQIHNLTLGLNMGHAKFDLQGLLDNEEFSILVNTILNDNLVNFLNTYHDAISHIVSPVLETIINGILGGGNGNSTVNTAEDVYDLIKADETLNREVFQYFHIQN